MLFGWFYYDWTILIVMPAFIFSLWAQVKVKSSFEKYSSVRVSTGLTGERAARRILDANGLYHVSIERVRGSMTDYFDPRTNTVHLSETVYDVSSIAAVGVAAHEVGHAIQHAKGYFPIKVRMAIIPITRFGSMLAMPLFILGLILANEAFLVFGILLYATVTLFQLITLPVEFNASRRAMDTLSRERMLACEELKGARSVLSSAAMTYVAALATSLLTLFRLVVLAGGTNNRRR